tara:strand:+ start:306 stop:782 length:477 start_codon:yes stop_codon:yes gene_type:complete
MNEKAKSLSLKLFSYGCYVLTSTYKEEICASTITWVSQCSFDPPMILACIKRNSMTYEVVKKSKKFNLHILSNKQKHFASCFFKSSKVEDHKINGQEFYWDENEMPVFKDSLSVLSCTVHEILEKPDHPVFISQIEGVDLRENNDPLELRKTGWSYGG